MHTQSTAKHKDTGSMFKIRGLATANNLSPSRVLVHGMTQCERAGRP